MKHGDFSDLAENYSKYRPGYSKFVRDTVLSIPGKRKEEIDFVDVGAGTGIWSRMVAEKGCRTISVEPNAQMMHFGEKDNNGLEIKWINKPAENTELETNSADIISMASSFHWTDFEVTMKEFLRILKPGGYFVALWNPRLIEKNPVLVDIENKLKEIVPDMKRVSSGSSAFCEDLMERLYSVDGIEDVVYLEGQHIEKQSKERYIGLWESVNDVRVQAGPERFGLFLDYIKARIKDGEFVEASYKTRAWIAKKKV